MILNISSEIKDIQECASFFNLDFESIRIIDFSCKIKISKPNFYSVCEEDSFDAINADSTRAYIKDIGKLSKYIVNGRSIRDYKICNFPLFWGTDLAEKHPGTSGGKNLYLMFNLLPKLKDRIVFPEVVYISIPVNSLHFAGIIRAFFRNAGITSTIEFPQIQHNKAVGPLIHIRRLLGFHLSVSLLRKKAKKSSDIQIRNFFITEAGERIVDKNYQDLFLHPIYELSKKKSSTSYWPIFSQLKTLRDSMDNLPEGYLESAPSCPQVFKLLIHWLFFSRVFRVRNMKAADEPSVFGDPIAIEREFRWHASNYLYYYYQTLWIENYFSKRTESVSVFYQNEIYSRGRMLSNAIGNKARKIGIQHGLFDLHHTVYGISNYEVLGRNSIPLPDKFVVWGNYFKNYFLSNNHLDPAFIKVLGSVKHTNRRPAKRNSSQDKTRVLWCTDTLDITMSDLDYLETTILLDGNYLVTMRPHPLADYIEVLNEKVHLFDRFPSIKVSNTYDILDDIEQHDLVIVNYLTTAFIDAQIIGKPCLRLFPYSGSPAYLKNFESPLVYNIFCKKGLFNALEVIKERRVTNGYSVDKDIIDLQLDGWKEMLYN